MAPSNTPVGRSEAERPGTTRRGLSVLHQRKLPRHSLRRSSIDLRTMYSAPGRGRKFPPRRSGRLPSAFVYKGEKALFFWTVHGPFSLGKTQRKWGVQSCDLRHIPAPKPAHPPSRRDDSRPRWGRQSCRFLETGSLFPPLAALRLFPPFSLGLAQRKRAVHGPKERRFFAFVHKG